MDHHFARRPFLQHRDRLQLGGDEPGGFVVFFELSADEQHRVGGDQLTVLAEGLRKHDHFDAAGDVVEHEDRHPIALLGLQRAQPADDAADPDVGERSR